MTTRTVNGTEYRIHGNGHRRPTFPVIFDENSSTGWRRCKDESEMDESSTGFEYLGWIYSLDEFTAAGPEIKALGFDGISTDSYFSATVVRLFDEFGAYDNQDIVVGRIHW